MSKKLNQDHRENILYQSRNCYKDLQ